MEWYCAHAIFYYELIDEPQDSYLIWENVYLVSGADDEQALAKAEEFARAEEEANEHGELTLNDKPCRYKYAGIRKLITVVNAEDPDNVLSHGAEVTYTEFEVDTLEQVMQLADGEFVEVLYRE